MKKFKREIKKIPKRMLSLMLVVAVLFSSIFPITKPKAVTIDTYGEGNVELQLNLTLSDNEDAISATVNGIAWTQDLQDLESEDNSHYYRYYSNGNYTIVLNITSTNDEPPVVRLPGGNLGTYLSSSEIVYDEENEYYTVTVTATGLNNYIDDQGNDHINNNGIKNIFMDLRIDHEAEHHDPAPGENPGQGGDPGQGEVHHEDEPHFDGRAVVVWSCASGICYHEFNDIPSFDNGNSKFYKDTEVIADNNRNEKFDVKAKYRGWYLTDEFEEWQEEYELATGHAVNWSNLDPEVILGAPNQNIGDLEKSAINANACNKQQDDFERCINRFAASHDHKIWTHQLQPVGEPTDNNAYVSYGDRNFKVVIYNEDYRGITIGDLSDLNYYPAEWTNPFLRQDQFDISNTTKNKPTDVSAILLEDTLNIRTLNPNGFEITKLEALDVPDGAVSISKVNGEWKLVFSSHFYDNVVFKVTDKDGGVYYFAVTRSTVDAWINNVEGAPHYYAEVYYDRNNTYKDFDISAKIIYKDGTIDKVSLSHYNKVDDGLGNISIVDEDDQEHPAFGSGGKGLKKAVFIYKLPKGKTDRDIKEAYTNIEFKGSTSDKYAGAFAGSGKGVLANIYQGEDA